MKKLYTLISVILLALSIHAQNPKTVADFETVWSNGKPNGWTDSRDITQVSPGQSGSFAAQGNKIQGAYPALITSSSGVGIPISTAYTYLNLYYKYTSVSADKMTIAVSIYDASHSQIGFANQQIIASAANFKAVSVPIYYSGSGPAEVVVSVLMNDSSGILNPHVGTGFTLDNITLGTSPLAVENIVNEMPSIQVFPNPASNELYIEAKNTSIEQVNIYNTKGSLVLAVTSPAMVNQLSVADLASGLYIAEIKTKAATVKKRWVKM